MLTYAGSRSGGDAAGVEKMTVGELREALKSRGLKVTGVKGELQQRLREAFSSATAATAFSSATAATASEAFFSSATAATASEAASSSPPSPSSSTSTSDVRAAALAFEDDEVTHFFYYYYRVPEKTLVFAGYFRTDRWMF